jgi:preprotein translocase subunit SecY
MSAEILQHIIIIVVSQGLRPNENRLSVVISPPTFEIAKSRNQHTNQFLDLAISNVGGDITTLNLFSLGLSPWLTTMIELMLIK